MSGRLSNQGDTHHEDDTNNPPANPLTNPLGMHPPTSPLDLSVTPLNIISNSRNPIVTQQQSRYSLFVIFFLFIALYYKLVEVSSLFLVAEFWSYWAIDTTAVISVSVCSLVWIGQWHLHFLYFFVIYLLSQQLPHLTEILKIFLHMDFRIDTSVSLYIYYGGIIYIWDISIYTTSLSQFQGGLAIRLLLS